MLSKLQLSLCLALVLAVPALAQPPAPPRPSPLAQSEQVVGVSTVSVKYSRPGVKGREIFGGLVPWGEVWRTGANEATLFEISDAAEINGKKLAAGKYALFTIPRKDSWTLIFSRHAEQWGSSDYKEGEDALRIEVKPQAIASQERFEIRFLEADENSATVELRWDTVLVPFTVAFDTEAIGFEQAKAFAAKAGKDDARAVTSWAVWCLSNDVGLPEAEAWMAKITAETDLYRNHSTYARLLAKNGKAKAAQAAADKALVRADGEEAKLFGVAADAEKLKAERATWK